MTIHEGLIWTYYDCSNACYLFGVFDLPCLLRSLSYILGFAIVGFAIVYLLNKCMNFSDKKLKEVTTIPSKKWRIVGKTRQ